MQHLAWTRTGRKYTHADEGKPNTFTLVTPVGQRNVDVNGDGTEYAPYVLSGAILRHGDSECEFSDGWQTLRRLGQTLISRSRLYVQRDVSGVWTDVPHGIPTRNVTHDYPREGACTAYLDFDQIQGYAAGARLQVGIEVGGSDQEIFGFRFRSPVAGTFRLEWVLEIPADVDLAWIEEPTSKADPTPIRVGGRIGNTEVRWSREEAPHRSVTVEPDGAGGRIVHVFLGPYTVAAMEWLTIYPDTVAGDLAATTDDGSEENLSWYSEVYVGMWSNYKDYTAWSFPLAASIPAGATIIAAYLRARCIVASSSTFNYRLYIESVDPDSAVVFGSGARRPSLLTYLWNGAIYTGSLAINTWYFGQNDTAPYNFAAGVQAVVDAYAPFQGRLNLMMRPDETTGNAEGQFQAAVNANEAQLSITYSTGLGLAQSAVQFRNDDGDQANATPAEDENAPLTAPAGTKRVRIQVNNTGDPAAITPQFGYRIKPSGGSYGPIRKLE